MPSMIDMLGAQAVKGNSTSAFDGVPDALKTGIGIAQAAQTSRCRLQRTRSAAE